MASSGSIFKQLKAVYADIDRETVEGDRLVVDTLTASKQKRIIAQVNEEYDLSFKFNETKRAKNLARLRLYNNQRRDEKAVGDPLMFTVFNTILASLWDDRLMSTWEGRSEDDSDDEVAENVNALANFDYELMGKSELDYHWDWDTCFFGRGLLLCMDFDRTEGVMAPAPEVLDASTFIRDPNAKSVNGDMRGRGAMRFGGWEVGATYWDLKSLPGYFNLNSLKKDSEVRSLLKASRDARSSAQGTDRFDPQGETLGKYRNYEFNLLNWMTTIKGEKYMLTLGNCRTQLIKMVKLDYKNRWPIVDRTLYPMSHDWDGVSIPDITEDKQRARAILMNIGLKSAKSDEMPQYLFDKNKIKNKNDLNWKHDKFIEVDGPVNNAIVPVNKSLVHQYVTLIMDSLDQSAQRATATPEIQQGMTQSGSRTLGELNLVSSKVDTRYSMSAKIFGWSEKAFWKQWYWQYKKHFKKNIDEKVLRIQGPNGPMRRTLTRENIIGMVDPDVTIESRAISEAKRQRDMNAYDTMAAIIVQDPTVNRRFVGKKMAKTRGLSKEEIDQMFPPTVDELQAEAENEVLNVGKLPKISVNDDHVTHIMIHAKAPQNPQQLAHIRAHKKLMLIRRDRPELFATATPQGQNPASVQGGQPGQSASPQPTPSPSGMVTTR